MLRLTFWNNRLVLFHNRGAISDLINVAFAVTLLCHIPGNLDSYFFNRAAFFPKPINI